MKQIPEWVLEHKKKGTVIKKIGDVWSLYSNTSEWDKEKKRPKAVQKYLGKITPEGLSVKADICVGMSGIRVREIGFTKAVMSLIPSSFLSSLGSKERGEKMVKVLVTKLSPNSACKDEIEREGIDEKNLRFSLSHQLQKLEDALPVPLSELEILKEIYLLRIGDLEVISEVTVDHKELLDRIGVDLI